MWEHWSSLGLLSPPLYDPGDAIIKYSNIIDSNNSLRQVGQVRKDSLKSSRLMETVSTRVELMFMMLLLVTLIRVKPYFDSLL